MNGLPEIAEAWTVKPGETVLLRSVKPLTPDFAAYTRQQLDLLTESSGIHFILLDSSVEVVNPHTGEAI